jgi:hypothetical protein
MTTMGSPTLVDGLANAIEPGTQVTGVLPGVALDNVPLDWFATNNLRAARIGVAEEVLVLSTSGLTTDTTANLLPGNALILAVDYVLTAAITGASVTGFHIGDATTANRFVNNDTVLTILHGGVGILCWAGAVSTTPAGPSQAAAAKVRVTAIGANPTAGTIRLEVVYLTFSAPTA